MVCTQSGKSPGTVTFNFTDDSPAAVPGTPGVFEISLSAGVATLTNCVCLVGMTTAVLPDMTVSLTGSSGFIGLVYDQNNDTLSAAIIPAFGGSGVAYDESFDPESQYVRIPIYKLSKTGGTWGVVYRAPGIPHFMVYKS